MSVPIEVTTRYATTVKDLPAAWAFVMDHLGAVGPDPRIEITPAWWVEFDGLRDRHFTVVVSGMVHEGEAER